MIRAALFLALVPCAALAQSDSRRQALGKQLAEDMESHSTIVNDATMLQYVSRIAQNLAQAGKLHDPLTVKVITGSTAYAFPGASCYVSGLILKAESEAGLAGAIAHLLGHIVFWRTMPVEIGPGTQIPMVWASGACARLAGAFAIPMFFANGQAILEAQSDQVGLEYMAKAGYDPEALADFFDRILSSGPKRASAFSSWVKFPASTRTQSDSLRDQRSD
jgi:beta-barrel assembly-enhancing protease